MGLLTLPAVGMLSCRLYDWAAKEELEDWDSLGLALLAPVFDKLLTLGLDKGKVPDVLLIVL